MRFVHLFDHLADTSDDGDVNACSTCCFLVNLKCWILYHRPFLNTCEVISTCPPLSYASRFHPPIPSSQHPQIHLSTPTTSRGERQERISTGPPPLPLISLPLVSLHPSLYCSLNPTLPGFIARGGYWQSCRRPLLREGSCRGVAIARLGVRK